MSRTTVSLAGALAGMLIVLFLRWRRFATRWVNDRIMTSAPDGALLHAIEEERGRLARDLHDAPLQDLAALIRRLDLRPGMEAETAILRSVTEDLRRVATELRPPVLDDLGLAAAISFAADGIRGEPTNISVTIDLDDITGLSQQARPPRNVEIAIFRVVQEAVTNAQLHSAGSLITITGSVGAEAVTLVVRDDGRGVSASALRDAAARGRLGMDSMRRRASSIGADLRVEAAQIGTRVVLNWKRL